MGAGWARGLRADQFAALAVSRYAHAAIGTSIRKIVHELLAVQTATIDINGQQLDFPADATPAATEVIGSHHRPHAALSKVARVGVLKGSLASASHPP